MFLINCYAFQLFIRLFWIFNLAPAILYIDMPLQVDMTALKQMGENDLKELGIPMVIVFILICGIYSGVLQWG